MGSIPRIFPYVRFFAVREGSRDYINNCFVAEQKTSRCDLRALFAAKVGFSLQFEFELLAILEEDTFLLPLKILDALDQFGNAAAGTRERKLSEM